MAIWGSSGLDTMPSMNPPRKLLHLAIGTAALGLVSVASGVTAAPPPEPIGLEPIGSYRASEELGVSAAEIVAHDPQTQRLFVVNADRRRIDVLDVADPTNPNLVSTISDLGGGPNSVDVSRGILAVAIENPVKDLPGWVAFFDADGNELNRVGVGALPDMLTFTPNGQQVVVANEGEPFADLEDEGVLPPYDPVRDPVGSVSVVDLRRGVERASVRTAGFEAFDRDELVAEGVRLDPGVPTVAQDLEPEYVTVSQDGRTAWVALQEANAIAEVDLRQVVVTDVIALGRKDHSLLGNGLDPSDRDGAASIRTFDDLYGIHMPDAIANVQFRGTTYLLTANEGDARAYTGLTDEARVRDLRDLTGASSRAGALCEDEFPNRDQLIEQSELGRLTVSTIDGYDPVRNCYAELHAFGARSFSVFTTDGELVWDSGDAFEQLTLAELPALFNAGHDNPEFDNRSDNKGPEPEALTIERIEGRTYAFIGFERIGGIATYDVTDPRAPVLVDYVNNRDVSAQLAGGDPGDLGPEGITVIRAADSPDGRPLVVVANEVSGTTTLFQVASR